MISCTIRDYLNYVLPGDTFLSKSGSSLVVQVFISTGYLISPWPSLACSYNIIMNELRFEWDEQKNLANIAKHQVSFNEAQSVFSDINARVISDPDHSDDEDRFIILGLSSKLRVLVVCHCYRKNDEVIRLISARKATKNEVKNYG